MVSLWGKSTATVISVCIPIIIILGTLLVTIFDESFYAVEMERLHVYESFSAEEIDELQEEILAFLEGKGTLETPLLNEKEKTHMQDVKALLDSVIFFFFLCVTIAMLGIIFLLGKREVRLIPKALIAGAILTIIINLLLVIISQTMFSTAFFRVHEALYDNDLWKLNPEEDALVQVYSEGFFSDLVMRSLIIASAIAIFFFMVAVIWLLRKKPRVKEKVYKKERPVPKRKKEDTKEKFQW